jgi:LmbE family N-acetylglucosaminyl deacetylase
MTSAIARMALALTTGALLVSPQSASRQAEHRVPTPMLTVSRSTRLMVIAPHPDDETLGAGGLIARVRAFGGEVRVVYVTDGDGYPEGVEAEDHIATPTAEDYRDYGRRRQDEARAAMKVLGVPPESTIFLAFPDSGLCTLITKYWSQRRRAYESPFTRLDRPPREDAILRSAEYRGEDLTQEIARVIGRFHPNLIVVPRKEDQHPDHCASWFFLADAITDVQRVRPEIRPDVVNYIVHFKEWPFQYEGPGLPPPPGLRGGLSGWMRFPLTPREQSVKRDALKRYRSQVDVMAWFLDGFARTNEVYSRPAPPHLYLPLRRSPCDCEQ